MEEVDNESIEISIFIFIENIICYNYYGDNMKRFSYLLFVISLFILEINVNAKTVTLDDMVEVINNGVITKEYLESKKQEKFPTGNKKMWKAVSVNASVIDGTLSIQYVFENREGTTSDVITAQMQEDGKTLKSVIYFDENQDGVNPDDYKYDIEVHNLIPLWEIEASDGWKEIKKYVEKDYINKLNTIIDRCYRQEMHACRTVVSTYGKHEYISDVEMNEEPANYVIEKLEIEAEEEASERFIAMLTIIAVLLVLVILVLKSFEPKAKAIKY